MSGVRLNEFVLSWILSRFSQTLSPPSWRKDFGKSGMFQHSVASIRKVVKLIFRFTVNWSTSFVGVSKIQRRVSGCINAEFLTEPQCFQSSKPSIIDRSKIPLRKLLTLGTSFGNQQRILARIRTQSGRCRPCQTNRRSSLCASFDAPQ